MTAWPIRFWIWFNYNMFVLLNEPLWRLFFANETKVFDSWLWILKWWFIVLLFFACYNLVHTKCCFSIWILSTKTRGTCCFCSLSCLKPWYTHAMYDVFGQTKTDPKANLTKYCDGIEKASRSYFLRAIQLGEVDTVLLFMITCYHYSIL